MHHNRPCVAVLVLWFAGLCAAAQFAKVGLVLPELSLMYPDANHALGLLVSSLSIIGAVLGLVAGTLAVKIGLRTLLLSGLLVGTLISLLQSTGLPVALLLASRVIEGCAHLAIVVSAPTLIAMHSSNRLRNAAMTLWSSFFGVSYALTALLGLPLVDTFGVNALFFAHGALMASVTLLVLFLIRDNETVADKSGEQPSVRLSLWHRHKYAWSSPFVSAPAAGWLFYTLTFVALLAILPASTTPEHRSFLATALPLASILTSMTLGILILNRLPAIVVVRAGFLIAIGSALCLIASPDSLWPAITLFMALGLVQCGSFAAVPQFNKSSSDQALANGALAQAGNTGNVLGTPLLLILLGVGGLSAVLVIVALLYAIAFCVHTYLAKRRANYAGKTA